VAGFLSSERCAGRYLLTIAQSMAFCSAIGIIGSYEAYYRNGIGGVWWGMLMMPVGVIIALTGWVSYRYRETRALTMAQFLEMRYSRRFRIFAGIVAFFSGMLNCAVFPMVTARFVIYFFGLPEHYELFGLTLPTYHTAMFVLVGLGVTMAIAGGQITIMVTDFFQGVITSVAFLAVLWFAATHFGWDMIMDTLMASETIDVAAHPDMVERLHRVQGVSMMNPFKQAGLPDFGVPYFIMMAILLFAKQGIWQGGAGYMTAARTPHEAKMGNILSSWRWLMINMGTIVIVMAAYTLVWNSAFAAEQAIIREQVAGIEDKFVQSQVFVPIVIRHMLPAGLLGLFAVYMIGASISTDDSAYHSWGSIFLQDVVMPFRKKPFTKEEHMRYLRWSIAGIGAFAFLFSSIWTLKEFINMWFEITGSIWFGGAACAIIGGLYWSRGTTEGAWAGLLTGSIFSVTGIVVRQIWPDMTFPWNDQIINGVRVAVAAVVLSFLVYFIVSLATCREPVNMDKLLHRGKYAIQRDREVKVREETLATRLLRKIGITPEFSRFDRFIYFAVALWTAGWSITFIIGTAYNLAHDVSSEQWREWWAWILGIQIAVAVITAVWYGLGGLRDVIRLYRDLATVEIDDSDDGTVRESVAKG